MINPLQSTPPLIPSAILADQEMRVKKRDGSYQEIRFDKILTRVKKIV